MSGWAKVGLLTVLAVVVLIGLNVSLWRRMKAATRAAALRRDEAEDDADWTRASVERE